MGFGDVVLHFWAPAHLLLVNLLSRAVICNYPHNRGLVNTPHPHCTNTLGLFTLILLEPPTPPPSLVQSKIPLTTTETSYCQKCMVQWYNSEPRREGLLGLSFFFLMTKKAHKLFFLR